VIKPLFILTLVSTALALIFSDNLVTFLKYFIFFDVLQVIIYNVYKNVVELFAVKLQNEKLKELSKQGMEVKCPCYLEKTMFVPVNLNGPNGFSCNECKKNVVVDITAKTFLQTEMIDLEKADEAFIKAYNKIQQNF
jgi:hypothetical protein